VLLRKEPPRRLKARKRLPRRKRVRKEVKEVKEVVDVEGGVAELLGRSQASSKQFWS
jgi:hypothetical protein